MTPVDTGAILATMQKSREGEPLWDEPTSVLLVDDETEFVDTLAKRLIARNYEVCVAYDGEQALAAVARESFDVMILDLRMPGMDGIEVLQRLKDAKHEVKVVILTGHGAAAEERAARALGAFEYLHKPADINELVDAMDRARAKLYESRSGP